jgi:hypothetical protein
MNVDIYLSVAGIFLNITGVILIFVYGISPFTNQDGIPIVHSVSTLQDKKHPKNKKRKRYKILSKLGLAACFFGGVFQIVALLFF